MKSCYLFLVLAVAAVNSKVIDINWLVDLGLFSSNQFIRDHKFTSTLLPEGFFGPKVSFAESVVVGFDSAKRTGNCTVKVDGKDYTIDLHYGLGLFEQTFTLLKFEGNAMTASYRIRDNSLHLAYTVHNTTSCYVTLDDLSLERLAKVDFYSSLSFLDGKDVDNYFENDVLPLLNKSINKSEVEKSLQAICKKQLKDLSEHMPLAHMAVIRHGNGLSAQ